MSSDERLVEADSARLRPIEIRKMTEADLLGVDAVWNDAFATSTEFPRSDTPRTDQELQADLDRRRHLLRSDPDGSLVAADGERIVGLAQGHRREGTYCLAMLAVSPDRQNQGIGRELLLGALEYAKGCAQAYIFSSSDPKALHRYVRAGFRLNPAMRISPKDTPTTTDASALRVATGSSEDLAVVDSIDATVRRARRAVDVAYWLSTGVTLVLLNDEGYALLGANRLVALAATNHDAARVLLAATLSGFPDGIVRSASWIVGQQEWAVAEAARLGATLDVHGAVMTRGVERFPEPYLPNGLFA